MQLPSEQGLLNMFSDAQCAVVFLIDEAQRLCDQGTVNSAGPVAMLRLLRELEQEARRHGLQRVL